jgi:prepilin-type N-terminal cleavage/methylation domain-containing protein
MQKQTNGFTLIELLVVIAIIGILSSVVLGALTTARAKGADAAVKEDLHGVRSQAEILYSDNGTYTGVCSDTKILSILAHASTTGGALTTCNESPTAWAATATLKGAGGFWCVDNSGAGVTLPTNIGTNTTCS